MNKTSKYNIYNMHKYWGKKPSEEIFNIINKYSHKGDTVLDPFSGYGGTGIESIILERNVILNDLNPVACFISKNILERDIDFNKFNNLFQTLKNQYEDIEKKLFYWKNKKIISILRESNKPTIIKFKNEYRELSVDESKKIIKDENNMNIEEYWYPKQTFIQNSRISIKKNTYMNDYFTIRTLIGNASLFDLINRLPNCNEKQLFLLAFTSNIANCSKLIPSIKTRGKMSPGSWMTGFYLPKDNIENNVFHYFENRVKKIAKGKKDFIALSKKSKSELKIYNDDAKKLPINSSTIDLVFTDFPYGDTVPYFEQSQLWNMWLKENPDYKNEIVISDSNIREKKKNNFYVDIKKSIKEINRVLKKGKYFVFTFHSMDFNEWKSIIESINEFKFEFVKCYVLNQKTLPPRQINRKNSIKGDIVIVYKKSDKIFEKINFEDVLDKELIKLKGKRFEKNKIIEIIVFSMLKSNKIENIKFDKIIDKYFEKEDNSNKWKIRHFLN